MLHCSVNSEICYTVRRTVKHTFTIIITIPNTLIINIIVLYFNNYIDCIGHVMVFGDDFWTWQKIGLGKGNTIHHIYYFIFETNIGGILFFNFSDEKTFMKR
jgi:hypothetical protein